jgi:hypothetical protein
MAEVATSDRYGMASANRDCFAAIVSWSRVRGSSRRDDGFERVGFDRMIARLQPSTWHQRARRAEDRMGFGPRDDRAKGEALHCDVLGRADWQQR